MELASPRAASKGGKMAIASGTRKLLENLKDFAVMVVLLALIYVYGTNLAAKAHGGHGDDHGEGHGDPHGDPHHGAEEHHRALSGHHVDPWLDVQVSVGICGVLIFVTVVFEVAKHKIEHDTPPLYTSVLNAMFGELTVLGFIALFTYFMLRLGVLEWFSMKIYHDPEHLIHLFEDIHFMLFFVMLIFLGEAVVLVNASIKAESDVRVLPCAWPCPLP